MQTNNYDFIKVIQDIKTPEQKKEAEDVIFRIFKKTKLNDYMELMEELNRIVYKDK